MTIASAFQPRKGANQKLTANITAAAATIGGGNRSLRFLNTGANVIFVRTYRAADGAETATNADTPIGPAGNPSAVLVIQKPQEHDTISYLAETGATVFHCTPGEGGY